MAERDEAQVWRLLEVLEKRSDSQMSAAAAGWKVPISTEAFILGSLFQSPWIGGHPHPLMPEEKAKVTDAQRQVARAAAAQVQRG